MTVARQAPPSMGFSRQECWSGLPFPSPGELPNPGIEAWSPILQEVCCTAGRFFTGTKEAALLLQVNIMACLREIARAAHLWRTVRKWMEKAMAAHSSTLAWKIPWTEEPGGLQSMGSLRVEHDWATSLSLLTFMHWRRKWQPTPVLLPGESQGRRSLVGCRLWGHTESDATEAT